MWEAGSRPRRDSGSTLIEMLVVLTIMALMASLCFGEMGRSMSALAFRRAANLAASDLRAARAQAILHSDTAALTLAPDGRSYTAGSLTRSPGAKGIAYSTANQAPLVFFADGSASGGVLAIHTASRRSEAEVEAATGAISVRARR